MCSKCVNGSAKKGNKITAPLKMYLGIALDNTQGLSKKSESLHSFWS